MDTKMVSKLIGILVVLVSMSRVQSGQWVKHALDTMCTDDPDETIYLDKKGRAEDYPSDAVHKLLRGDQWFADMSDDTKCDSGNGMGGDVALPEPLCHTRHRYLGSMHWARSHLMWEGWCWPIWPYVYRAECVHHCCNGQTQDDQCHVDSTANTKHVCMEAHWGWRRVYVIYCFRKTTTRRTFKPRYYLRWRWIYLPHGCDCFNSPMVGQA